MASTKSAAARSPDSFMFTVGKLDAGMAILLGERAHLIEFPSILLPLGATAGSIVNIAVHRNTAEEKRRDQEFWDLQKEIYETFGIHKPQPPKLEVRNVTQTSVTLQWPPLQLATAKLRSLDIYRNGQRLAAIPQPLQNTSTKLSGLELDTDYSFQLVLRTTAGTFPSAVVRVRTHIMTNTSGISVCFGTVQEKVLLENAKFALREMGARWSERIEIDTSHFVCTTPAAEGGSSSGPSIEYQRALQLSIPVVQPHWILACHAERKMMPISQFYLGATPSAAVSSASFTRPQSMSQVSLQRSSNANARPTSGNASTGQNRASMPSSHRSEAHPSEARASTFLSQSPQSSKRPPPNGIAAVSEPKEGEVTFSPGSAHSEHTSASGKDNSDDTDEEHGHGASPHSNHIARSNSSWQQHQNQQHARNGTMDRNFRFPPPASAGGGPGPGTTAPPPSSSTISMSESSSHAPLESMDADVYLRGVSSATSIGIIDSPTTTRMEVPPPDPVPKEHIMQTPSNDSDDEIGTTEEIALN